MESSWRAGFLNAVFVCLWVSQDDEVFCEEKEATMGKPQIKFGDHVVYIRHINSLLWLGHQVIANDVTLRIEYLKKVLTKIKFDF